MAALSPADERRHPPGAERDWEEWWTFEVATTDASLGLLVRLGLWPNLGVAWYWAYLVGDGRPLLAVRHHEVPLPRGTVLEVRAESLWSAIHCETPFEHWSVGLEAFAVALDEPAEAYRGERGDLVPLGLDLEWEVEGPLLVPAGATRYDQGCMVHGEVLVGNESIDVHAPGHRARGWGPGGGWRSPWCRASGWLSDATTFAGAGSEGVVALEGTAPVGAVFSVAGDRDEEGFARSALLRVGEFEAAVEPRHHVAVPLDGPGAGGRLAASLSRFSAGGGATGAGWVAWHDPLSSAALEGRS